MNQKTKEVYFAIAIDSDENVCMDHIVDEECEGDILESVDKVALMMAHHHSGNNRAFKVDVKIMSVTIPVPDAYQLTKE